MLFQAQLWQLAVQLIQEEVVIQTEKAVSVLLVIVLYSLVQDVFVGFLGSEYNNCALSCENLCPGF